MHEAHSRPSSAIHVRVQADDFDVQAELAALRGHRFDAGALCNFVGLVRAPDATAAMAPGPVLWLEHYPGMTEASIHTIAEQALTRFDALAARVVHRVGPLALGEHIVLVAVLAAHRHAAFLACEYLMDQLKTQAPFWKKEWRAGQVHWVEAKASDDCAAARWNEPPA